MKSPDPVYTGWGFFVCNIESTLDISHGRAQRNTDGLYFSMVLNIKIIYARPREKK